MSHPRVPCPCSVLHLEVHVLAHEAAQHAEPEHDDDDAGRAVEGDLEQAGADREPSAPLSQSVAAAVSPRTLTPILRIAPTKPMPVATWAATREGSMLSLPTNPGTQRPPRS